jgi:hypothetical protein
LPGLWGPVMGGGKDSGTRLERRTGEGESPVGGIRVHRLVGYPSRPGHEESWLNQGGPSSKAKYESVTDSGEYREGKVKRTPDGE